MVCATHRNLKGYFGADEDMRAITTADADDWAAWLRTGEGLAENTIRKRCQFAKKFFSVAVRRKLLPENPFADLVGVVVSVPERQYFVARWSPRCVRHGKRHRRVRSGYSRRSGPARRTSARGWNVRFFGPA